MVARFAFVAATLALASACGGKETSSIRSGGGGDTGAPGNGGAHSGGNASGGIGAASGGSSVVITVDSSTISGVGPVDAGTIAERRAACQHTFSVQHSTRCGGPTLLAEELSRRAALFEADCVKQFDLPGNGVTAAALEACASATEAAPCQTPDGPPPECDLRGMLPVGAPCFHGTQCQSGVCPNQDFTQGGPSALHCGTCTDMADKIGGSCSNGGCPAGSRCVNTDPMHPSATCLPLVVGDDGDSCDEISRLCALGLYCDGLTRRCVPLRGLGEPCGSNWVTGCVPPLYCSDAPGVCAAPGKVGDPCEFAAQCSAGLACDYTTNRCSEVEWNPPGAPCDAGAHLCRTGECQTSTLGMANFCPFVVAEGQACEDQHVCDEGSVCFGGKCVGSNSVECR